MAAKLAGWAPSIGAMLPPFGVSVTVKAIVMGATAARDWQPLHHDHAWAVEQGGLPAIIANNHTQAGWISRYITDSCGPAARICRLRLRMRKPVCPGDELMFSATVTALEPRDAATSWVHIDVGLAVGDAVVTTASLLVALPARPGAESPWRSAPGSLPELKPSFM